MGIQSTIDIRFGNHLKPKEILRLLLELGWDYNYDGQVAFLPPGDNDNFDWQTVNCQQFNIESFLSSHNEYDKIGMALVTEDGAGGDFRIMPDMMVFSLNINRRYINSDHIIDFSWYLNKLTSFFQRIYSVAINCEIIF